MSSTKKLLLAMGALGLAGLVSTSLHVIEPDERAVLLRFGRSVRVVGPGLQLTAPWPLGEARRVSTGEVRTIEVGFSRADRDQGLPPTPREVQWLTSDTNIIEVQATANYSVEDPTAYLFGVADEEEREDLLRAVLEATFTRTVAGLGVDEILAGGQGTVARAVQASAQEQVDDLGLGLRLNALNLVSVTPPQAVIGAFNDVSSARSNRERDITRAEGLSAERLPEARARADRLLSDALRHRTEVLAGARAEADRFLRLQAEIQRAPELARARLWYSTARELLSEGRIQVIQPPEEGVRRRVWLEK